MTGIILTMEALDNEMGNFGELQAVCSICGVSHRHKSHKTCCYEGCTNTTYISKHCGWHHDLMLSVRRCVLDELSRNDTLSAREREAMLLSLQ